MQYNIYYVSSDPSVAYPMFSLNYELKQFGDNDQWWHSVVNCKTYFEGIANYVRKRIVNEGCFDFDGFVKDAKEIEDIQGLLTDKYGIVLMDFHEACEFHYRELAKELESHIKEFCSKYGLITNKTI